MSYTNFSKIYNLGGRAGDAASARWQVTQCDIAYGMQTPIVVLCF